MRATDCRFLAEDFSVGPSPATRLRPRIRAGFANLGQPIELDVQQPHLLRGDFGANQRIFKPLLKQNPVGQLSKLVVMRQLSEPNVGALSLDRIPQASSEGARVDLRLEQKIVSAGLHRPQRKVLIGPSAEHHERNFGRAFDQRFDRG